MNACFCDQIIMDQTSVLLFALISLSSTATDLGLQCTNPHEEAGCVESCPPERSCRSLHIAVPCVPPTEPCKPQCVCVDRFARNVDGLCITFEQCDQCPGYSQHFACDGPYDPQCEGACRCNAGYSPAGNSTCVLDNPPAIVVSPPGPPPTQTVTSQQDSYPEDDSPLDTNQITQPDLQCTNPNEEVGCVESCPPERTCRNRLYALPCALPTEPCTLQCVCVDGFARNVDGICITFEQCDQCPGYSQHFACDGPYDPQCEGACRCDTGYSPAGNSTCVRDNPPATVIFPPLPTTPTIINYPPSPASPPVIYPLSPPSPAVIYNPSSPPTNCIIYNPPSPPASGIIYNSYSPPTEGIIYNPPSPPTEGIIYNFPSPPTSGIIYNPSSPPTEGIIYNPPSPPTEGIFYNFPSPPTSGIIYNPSSPPTEGIIYKN